ncbi:type II secretion system F family protein [Lentibacillus salinarum]|uniref:Type II secretion system F family protein n=1 Tax=Lentibacillus salinarum TaxID=446820 RepID=A0ABW3ZXU7_9BACI
MIFTLTMIAILFIMAGIYLLATNRKKRLNRVIFGEEKTSDPPVNKDMLMPFKDLPRHLVFAGGFFVAGWFLVGGILWGAVFAVVGLFMPLLMRSSRKKKELRRMEKQLEDVLYQGTNVLRGGGGLYQFMEHLAAKTPKPLHDVFDSAFVSIQELGTPSIDALKKAADDNPDLTDLGMMASALEEAQKNGADLAEVVEMFASDVRNRRTLQQEIESKTTQGVFTANLLLGIGIGVPALLQAYGSISNNPTLASGSSLVIDIMTAVCYMMMIAGYLIIRRMTQV